MWDWSVLKIFYFMSKNGKNYYYYLYKTLKKLNLES